MREVEKTTITSIEELNSIRLVKEKNRKEQAGIPQGIAEALSPVIQKNTNANVDQTINLPINPRLVKSQISDAPVPGDIEVPQHYIFSRVAHEGIKIEYMNPDTGGLKSVTVLPFPIVITKIFEGTYGGNDEELELAFFNPRNSCWKTFIIKRETLSKESTITQVNNYGYTIQSAKDRSTAKQLMQFLNAFEKHNYYKIPRQTMVTKIGFTEGLKSFSLYDPNIKIKPQGKDETDLLEKGYVMAGENLNVYVEKIKEIVADYSVPTFCYSLAFASPLLKIIDAPPFSVEICRHSGYGKSLIQKLALGVWGKPSKLMRQWKMTLVGIERSLDFADGVITCLEDAQINMNDSVVADVFYMVFNGTGKIRGSKEGGTQKTPEFKGILLSSTESESSQRIKLDGIRRRMVELPTMVFPSKEYAKKAGIAENELHSKFYGVAGEKWTNFLLQNRDSWDKWKAEYNFIVNTFDDEAKLGEYQEADLDTIMDQNRLLATVSLAMQLMNQCFNFDFDFGRTMKEIRDLVYGQLVGNSKPISALRSAVSWAIINQGALFVENSKRGEQHGVIKDKAYVAFVPDSLNGYLKEQGYNLSVLDEWKRMDIIELDSEQKNPKTSLGTSTRARLVRLKWSKLVEYCGEGFYEEEY